MATLSADMHCSLDIGKASQYVPIMAVLLCLVYLGIYHKRRGRVNSRKSTRAGSAERFQPLLISCCFQLWYNISTMQNLWEEFDNKHSPASSETVGQGHHGRNRRLTERDILSSLRSSLLQDYVAPYCRSLAATRIYRRCYWIDGWGINPRANSGTINRDVSKKSAAPVLQIIVVRTALFSVVSTARPNPASYSPARYPK